MSRPSSFLTATALFALLAAPSLAQTGLLVGTVIDSEEEPLSGVEVTVTSEELPSFRKTLRTGEDGRFRMRFQSTQTRYRFELLFEKPGYKSFTVPLTPSAIRQMREEFVMEASETPVAAESHGDLASVVSGSTSAAVEAFNAGLAAQREGELETARERYEEALAADPDLGPAHVALAQVLLDQGEYGLAADAAERALELDAGRVEALQVKHRALRALGRSEEAEAVAVALEEAEDAVATARRLYNEGGEAFQAGDRDTALAKFRRAAELDPSLIEAHHSVATLELAEGNHQAAAEAAETALALGSDDVRSLRVLYGAYEALGRRDELVDIAPRLAAVDPEFGAPKLVEQAAEAWNAGRAEEAATLSRQALAIDPELAKAYYFIGLHHLSSGENAEAKAALQKFVELAPDDPEAATAEEMLSYIE